MLTACGDELTQAPSSSEEPNEVVAVQLPVTDVSKEAGVFPSAPAEVVVEDKSDIEEVPSAFLTFVANLPAANEVNAAFISDSHFIDIDVYSVPFASFDEYHDGLDACETSTGSVNDCFEMTWVSGGVVDSLNPELQFGFIPGNYLVKATPYHQKANGDVVNQGAIIAFSELSSGEHSIPLYALEANWTFETPVDLVLLNQADPFDLNSDAVVDANPITDEIESFAEVLLLDNDSPLSTLHLPSIERAAAFSSNVRQLHNPIIEQTHHLDSNSEFVPILSQVVNGDITPIDYSNYLISDYASSDSMGYQFATRNMSSASVAFSYADGVVNQDLHLGSYAYNYMEGEGEQVQGVNAGLFFVSDWSEFLGDSTDVAGESIEEDGWVYPHASDSLDAFEHVYSMVETNDLGETAEVDSSLYITNYLSFRSVYQDLDGLLAAFDNETFTTMNIQSGVRITGSLIEYAMQSSQGLLTPLSPEDAVALLPTHDDIVTLLGVALIDDMLSENEVSAANSRSDACFDLSNQRDLLTDGVSVAFIDDEWQAGAVNYSYTVTFNSELNIHEVEGDDLNGDGSVDYFETGVFANTTCEYDPDLDADVCSDLDGDGEGHFYESIAASTRTDVDIEVCVHPIILNASSLEMPQADLEVVISSEK